jgi:5-methylcytosine-specific restriction endonuclease McrBC regulatory subunit McrC
MEQSRKSIILSLNQIVRIDELFDEEDSEMSLTKIIHEFEYYLSKHFYQFGSRPYSIEYLPGKGYTLRASSLIGKISTPNYDIVLNPKFKELSFGKCLALAQSSNSSMLNIASNEFTQSLISNKYDYSTFDYLGFGLIDAVNTIINNGLARTFKDVIGDSVKLRGTIALIESISSGKGLFKPFINDTEPDYNIYPNRLIKTALTILVSSTKNNELKNAANIYLNHFKESTVLDKKDIELLFGKYLFNLPRIDYEKGILYSTSIIEGGMIDSEGKSIGLPSITMDLDKIFEYYVSNTTSKMLGKERFEVLLQPNYEHKSTPQFNNKKIIPDIIIKDKRFNRSFVVDTKNKYSELSDNGIINLNNSDIFQITYYCNSLQTYTAILLFPSIKPKIQFPIKGSESESSFKDKCDQSFQKLLDHQSFKIFDNNQISLIVYHIDLGGSMFDTEKSIASFCQLISYLSQNEK